MVLSQYSGMEMILILVYLLFMYYVFEGDINNLGFGDKKYVW